MKEIPQRTINKFKILLTKYESALPLVFAERAAPRQGQSEPVQKMDLHNLIKAN